MTIAPDPVSAADLLSTFPFPFNADTYRYSTNLEPAGTAVRTAAGQWGDTVVTIDSEYAHELGQRRRILVADPSRYAVLPHMRSACWDTMLVLMTELASAYPESMSLSKTGETWRWRNQKTGAAADFVVGDESTLPAEPLAYIGDQVQEDIVLLDQRDGDLFADAGVVTFASGWSFGFDVGMTFLEVHGPVPRLRASGVITRAREFILRLQPGEIFRRTNWTLDLGRRLDASTETLPERVGEKKHAQTTDTETFGRLVHLRVEVQHLIRLPESGAVCFLIRTHMLPFCDLATVRPWRERTAAVLAELPEDLADYKGFLSYRDRAVRWLSTPESRA